MVSVAQTFNAGEPARIHSRGSATRGRQNSSGITEQASTSALANDINRPAITAAVEPVVVETLYPYAGDEENHLSFSKGDLVEVWGREATGWWDGILIKSRSHVRGARGWFPSSECHSYMTFSPSQEAV